MKNRQSLCGKGEGVSTILGWVRAQMRTANRESGGGRIGVFGFDFRPIHNPPAMVNQNANPCTSAPYIVDGGRGEQESVQLRAEKKPACTCATGISRACVRVWARVCGKTITHPQTFQP